jgi:hypothetical protein
MRKNDSASARRGEGSSSAELVPDEEFVTRPAGSVSRLRVYQIYVEANQRMELLSLSARKGLGLAFAVVLTLLFTPQLKAEPPARSLAGMVYDETRQGMVLFGGLSGPTVIGNSSSARVAFDDTWVWTGRRWARLQTEHAPEARYAFVMEYDSNRDQTVLFGGLKTDLTHFNDTWIFKDGDWQQLNTPNAPSARRISGSVFDPIRDRMILFGGADPDTAALSDTWAFDGTTWTKIHDNGPKVIGPVLTYDAQRDAILLLGRGETTAVPEMYRWTGSGWEKLAPTLLPRCPAQSAMAFQRHNGKVLQYGGVCANGVGNNETLEWDGTNWTKVEITVAPAFLFGQVLEYDEARQETLMFGGRDIFEQSVTYRFRDGRWSGRSTFTVPNPRSLAVLFHDPVSKATWLYGGIGDNGAFFDFWKYEDGRWRLANVTATPTICTYPVSTYDSDRKKFVMVCEDSSTYEFDPAAQTWQAFTNPSEKPPSRRFSSIAYDPVRKKTVLFGGFDLVNFSSETWVWNGTTWDEINTRDEPNSRMLSAMFWDPIRQRITLFGGIGRQTRDDRVERFGDMWTFDGSTWTEITPAALPSARYATAVSFDPINNRVMMFGGKSGEETFLDELWAWDGDRWTQVTAPGISPRMNSAMVFDTNRNQFLLFGGYAGHYFGELWTLTPTGWSYIPETVGRGRGTTRGTPTGSSFAPWRE